MKNPIIIILLVLLGFTCTFFTGFYVHAMLQTERHTPNRIPTPSAPEATGSAGISTQFLPDTFYFDDTAIFVTKNEPHYSVAATVNRSQVTSGYSQSTRISYFDGNNWIRKTANNATRDSRMVKNSLLKKWDIVTDPSRVLKESITGSFMLDGTAIDFETGSITNEIGMRSLPGYTKFMSRGTGFLSLNGKKYAAHVLYTRIYSLNAHDIQFYDTPLGLTTDWVAFWGTDGNFYHIDKTSVGKPTEKYQTHEIAVLEDPQGRVAKTFTIDSAYDVPTSPQLFSYNLHDPLNVQLSLQMKNQFNKYPSTPYTWFMGQITGSVTKSDGSKSTGFGLVEYIHD